MSKTKNSPVSIYALTDDPIELHILEQLERLKQQNIRYKEHISKTASSILLKKVSAWKSFDFYNYFCKKYFDNYRVEFRSSGSVVRHYHRIEKFMLEHRISNENYKAFIDISFSRYFNEIVRPVIGNLFSISLYKKMVTNDNTYTDEPDDLYILDQVIAKEGRVFEEAHEDLE
jgi:hypothetical protein